MSEQPMRERIARTLARSDLAAALIDGGNSIDTYPAVGIAKFMDHIWDEYVPWADAILAAMETPTDGMLKAANSDWSRGSLQIWQAMIAEARKP